MNLAATTPTCLVVLGMHRSGTSALTGTLSLLGATVPSNLMGSATSNSKGHFESAEVMAVNEEMLRVLHTAWYDFRGISLAELGNSLVQEFEAKLAKVLQDSCREASLFVLKDPRFCRFLPLVRSAVEDCGTSMRVVFCFRNPLEVAESLKSRDGLSLSHGLSLWMRHMLDAEFDSRGIPRVFIYFSDFLRNWGEAVDQMEHHLEISFPRRRTVAPEIDEFLDASLRHHSSTMQEVEESFGYLNWFGPCFEAVCDLARDPNDAEAMRRLDAVRTSFEHSANFFGPAFQDYYGEILQLKQDVVRTRCEFEAAQAQFQAQLDAAASELKRANAKRTLLKSQYSRAQKELSAIRSSRSWRVTSPLRKAVTSFSRLASFVRSSKRGRAA
jgi:hypothetical protein